MTQPRIVILASGGPAPGINSVINAATIEALNQGWKVFGSKDGYRGLVDNNLRELKIEDVSWIHYQGGAILGMSRTNPKTPANLEKIVSTLTENKIDMMLTIGGDDTAFGAATIADALPGKLKTVHVPKTIDNDLPLPAGVPTFGFTTARSVGVGLVKNLMRDAQTCSRWYVVISMGRQAGHLALGIGKAAGANVTLIPEEFDGDIALDDVITTLEGSVIKGLAHGRKWGVAVVAEGIIENLRKEDFDKLPNIRRDAFGHILMADVNFGKLLCAGLDERFADSAHTIRFNDVTLGYELRCADPVPFDIEYTRDLGYAAVKFLCDGGTNGMVMIVNGERQSKPFHEMRDPETGKTVVRNVDTASEPYLVARRYMQRFSAKDLDSKTEVDFYAKAAGCSSQELLAKFGPLVENEPAEFAFDDTVRDALDHG